MSHPPRAGRLRSREGLFPPGAQGGKEGGSAPGNQVLRSRGGAVYSPTGSPDLQEAVGSFLPGSMFLVASGVTALQGTLFLLPGLSTVQARARLSFRNPA